MTKAERDILLALAAGLTAKEVAHLRRTSLLTARSQIKAIKAKLGTHTIAHAVAVVLRNDAARWFLGRIRG